MELYLRVSAEKTYQEPRQFHKNPGLMTTAERHAIAKREKSLAKFLKHPARQNLDGYSDSEHVCCLQRI